MKNKLLSIILISSLGIIVYLNSFSCSFHFDDFLFIINNPYIKDISNLQNIWDWWPCRFITFLSFAVNYSFYHFNIFGYHLFNLGIHIASSLLVWWFVYLTLSTPAMKGKEIVPHADLIALFTGLVFISHPIQTQAVTFIWQRAASMAALFYLASLCFYIKSRLPDNRTLSPIIYTCSLITALLAMFTKETAITLPLMIMLYEISFLKTTKHLHWKCLAPFLLIFLIIPVTWMFTGSEKIRATHSFVTDISSVQYLVTEFRVILTYLRLALLPIHQNFDYDYSLSKSIFEAPALISFLFLAGVLFFAQRMFSKYRLVSFAVFWFFLTLLPESSFFPFADVIEEHRLYLPLAGYSIFLVSSLYYLLGKNSVRTMTIVLTMIIACNGVLTYQRNKIWRDEFTLWNDTVQKSPQKARPYNNRGVAYASQGKFIQALSDFTMAIKIYPRYTDAYNDRGFLYSSQGELTQARSDFNKAIEINPDYAPARQNLAALNMLKDK